MPWGDPFRNYDAWLTTDRNAEAQDRYAEAEMAAWERWCDTEQEDGGGRCGAGHS
jgi:hypothetical protein